MLLRAARMKMQWPLRLLLVVWAIGGVACNRTADPPRDGTAQMTDTLRVIHARALAAPMSNIFLNRARADTIQAGLARQSESEARLSRYSMLQERLRAGQTREAIDELHALMRAAGISPDQITPDTKPLFDLLAIAWLRLGEQENCLTNPGANVCILPLDGAGRHKLEEGARKAIAQLEALLARFPEDHGSRWLLNVAFMSIGGYPNQVPKRFLIPGLAPKRGATFPRFPNVAVDLGVAVNNRAGGLSIEDFNRDGFLDLFMTSWGLDDSPHLFLADGRGGFADRTAEAGLSGIVGGLNNLHADYDNDGFEDIVILRGAWLGDAGAHPNSLLHNNGDGTFADVTFSSGLLSFHPTQTGAWADFNLDGHLDLFIGNESAKPDGGTSRRSELWLNNGNGTFTEVSHQVGIDLDEFVKAVVWGDVNNDGLPDLFASILFGPNRLYINRGGRAISTWRFEERGREAGVQLPLASFPAWFWDFDQDGWEDLLVLSYDNRHSTALHEAVAREYLGLPRETIQGGRPLAVEPSRLFRNKGDGTFEDVTRQAGLLDKVFFVMGSNFGDLDNDGWLDFYLGTGNPDLRSIIPNRMFRSVGGRRFEEVTIEGGFGHLQKGHAIAFADLDRDGDEDIYSVIGGAFEGDRFANVLFENPGWPGRSWIVLQLEGRTANRSAIGARVELTVTEVGGGTRTLHRTVGTGGSFGAGSLQLHIGLGRATRVARLDITWPDADHSTTSYADLAVDRVYHIIQGGLPTALERPPVEFRRSLGSSQVKHDHQ